MVLFELLALNIVRVDCCVQVVVVSDQRAAADEGRHEEVSAGARGHGRRHASCQGNNTTFTQCCGSTSGSAPFPRIRIRIRILVSDPDPLNVFRYHTQKYFNRKLSKL